jgi:hypothetical protein
MGLLIYFLVLRGAARERLFEDYESFRATRGVHRGAALTTISNSPFLMTPNVAFDVRTAIPPFPSVLRNADGVFGAALRTSAPEHYVAFLPWAVEHTPPEARSSDFEQVKQSVTRVGGNDLVRDIIRAYEPAPGTTEPAARLHALGRYLSALGTMSPRDFDSFASYQLLSAIGHRLDTLTRVVDEYGGQPEQWARDCKEVVENGTQRLTEGPLMIADLPAAEPGGEFRIFQQLLKRYGNLIEVWPTLLEAAADMRVAEPIRTS